MGYVIGDLSALRRRAAVAVTNAVLSSPHNRIVVDQAVGRTLSGDDAVVTVVDDVVVGGVAGTGVNANRGALAAGVAAVVERAVADGVMAGIHRPGNRRRDPELAAQAVGVVDRVPVEQVVVAVDVVAVPQIILHGHADVVD